MPSYIDNSNIFGSIMINRKSCGDDLYNKLNNMTFNATDFPEPVVPATNKCGILAKSTTTGSPAISFPNAMVKEERDCRYTLDANTSFKVTISREGLGNSRPITDFPGI